MSSPVVKGGAKTRRQKKNRTCKRNKSQRAGGVKRTAMRKSKRSQRK